MTEADINPENNRIENEPQQQNSKIKECLFKKYCRIPLLFYLIVGIALIIIAIVIGVVFSKIMIILLSYQS